MGDKADDEESKDGRPIIPEMLDEVMPSLVKEDASIQSLPTHLIPRDARTTSGFPIAPFTGELPSHCPLCLAFRRPFPDQSCIVVSGSIPIITTGADDKDNGGGGGASAAAVDGDDEQSFWSCCGFKCRQKPVKKEKDDQKKRSWFSGWWETMLSVVMAGIETERVAHHISRNGSRPVGNKAQRNGHSTGKGLIGMSAVNHTWVNYPNGVWKNYDDDAWINCSAGDWTRCTVGHWINCAGGVWKNCADGNWLNCAGGDWINCTGVWKNCTGKGIKTGGGKCAGSV